MRTHISVRTLGSVAIDVGSRRIGPSAGQLFGLLLYLTSKRGHGGSRRAIQELFFPECAEEKASHNLRQLIYRSRQAGVSVETDANHIAVPPDDVTVDWQRLLDGHPLDAAELQRLSQGVFPGYNPNLSDAFSEWFEAERAEITQRLSRFLGVQLTQLRRAGRWDLVELASRALLGLDPLSEEGTLAKAEVLAVSGSKRAALEVIDTYLRELGEKQPHLQIAPLSLKRRISERLPEASHRTFDERLFVGREDSMRTLSALGGATRAGRQQVVLLWGEPGIGKTRLVAEYRALAALQGGITIGVSCQPHDVFRPLGTLCDLVTQLLSAPGALGCDPGARALLARLANLNRHVDDAREEVASETPLSAIVRSLGDLISAVALEYPLQIFIDDAQWLDRNSQHAILGAFAPAPSRRSSLVLTSRDRALLDVAESQAAGMCSVRLQPLPHEAALELARTLLRVSRSTGLETGARQVIEQGRGNPFVIRVLCSHLASTNDSESLKQTLTEILTRRLDQLPVEARRTLEGAVILGKNCTFERLERLLETPRDRLLGAIEVLDDQGLIEVTDGFIVSSHALLGAVVGDRMAPSVKRVLHGAAAELLYRDVHASRGGLLWDCAAHLQLAGDRERAVLRLEEHATRAAETGRSVDALATLQHSLTFQPSNETRLRIVERALEALWTCQIHSEVAALLSERKRLRMGLNLATDSHDTYEVLELSAERHGNVDIRERIPRLRECVLCTGATPRHRATAARELLMTAEATLDQELAEFAYRETRALETPRLSGLLTDVLYHTCFGDPATAAALAGEVVALCLDDLPHSSGYLLNAGYAQYRIGRPDEAEETLLLALTTARRYDHIAVETQAISALARLCWSTERLADCRAHLHSLEVLLTRYTDAEVSREYCVVAARLATLENRFGEARDFISRGRLCAQANYDLPRLLLIACEFDVRLIEPGVAISEQELTEFLSLCIRARNIGCQDEVMTTLYHVTQFRGRGAEGDRIISEYLSEYRRDGFPVSRRLSAALESARNARQR